MSEEIAPDDRHASSHPHAHYYGGQAVIEGVMMRGARVWAIAVRRPSGEIYLERHPVSTFPQRVPAFKKPMLRGMFALVDSLRIGTRALAVSANESAEESEQLSSKQMGGSLVLALLMFVGVFVLLPNVGLAFFRNTLGDELLYHFVEGVVRIGIFLGYLGLISRMSDIRRVFEYHGAEHKTIAAWEHGQPLDPSAVQPYSTLHVRCGTNFLIMVMLIALIVYSVAGYVVPAPDAGALAAIGYHTGLRVVLLPVVAGLAYEGLRLGAGRHNIVVRALMKPGLWLQMVTTKPPTEDQVEVAIRAFEAVVPRTDLADRVAPDLPSAVVWGPDEVPEGDYGLRVPAGSADSDLTDVTGAPISNAFSSHSSADEEPTAGT